MKKYNNQELQEEVEEIMSLFSYMIPASFVWNNSFWDTTATISTKLMAKEKNGTYLDKDDRFIKDRIK